MLCKPKAQSVMVCTYLLRLIRSIHVHHVLAAKASRIVIDDRIDHTVPDGFGTNKLRTLDRLQLHLFLFYFLRAEEEGTGTETGAEGSSIFTFENIAATYRWPSKYMANVASGYSC